MFFLLGSNLPVKDDAKEDNKLFKRTNEISKESNARHQRKRSSMSRKLFLTVRQERQQQKFYSESEEASDEIINVRSQSLKLRLNDPLDFDYYNSTRFYEKEANDNNIDDDADNENLLKQARRWEITSKNVNENKRKTNEPIDYLNDRSIDVLNCTSSRYELCLLLLRLFLQFQDDTQDNVSSTLILKLALDSLWSLQFVQPKIGNKKIFYFILTLASI